MILYIELIGPAYCSLVSLSIFISLISLCWYVFKNYYNILAHTSMLYSFQKRNLYFESNILFVVLLIKIDWGKISFVAFIPSNQIIFLLFLYYLWIKIKCRTPLVNIVNFWWKNKYKADMINHSYAWLFFQKHCWIQRIKWYSMSSRCA